MSSANESFEKQRLLRVDQIFSRRDRRTHFVRTAKNQDKKHERMSKTAIVVRRIISQKGLVDSIEVDIRSEILKEVLSENFGEAEDLELNKSPAMVTRELLYFAKDAFVARLAAEEAEKAPNETVIADLRCAVNFVQEDFGTTIDSLRSLEPHNEISYDLLWALFPPDCAVYTTDNLLREPQVALFVAGEYTGAVRKGRKEFYFIMRLRLISHDGNALGAGEIAVEIPKFNGRRAVHQMRSFPLSMHPERDQVEVQLIERGKRFVQSVEATCWDFDGAGISEDTEHFDEEAGRYKQNRFYLTGRIMLDPVTFRQRNRWSDLMDPYVTIPKAAEDFTDADFLTCNHVLLGFSFTEGTWGAFSVASTKDVVWNPHAFEKLVMETAKRDVIHSLVRSHRNDSKSFDDIIKGKGQGLVGLLSGNPGVGKTLTAEVISEVTKRPLYMVSAGELGTEVDEIEQRLDMLFAIGGRWRCILLIDEADVFLQARSGTDLVRNALVSIFLRRLEYFRGILILTTNRESEIDHAFLSRMHFKLRYDDLSTTQRKAIWKNFLSNSPSGHPQPQFSDDDLESLALIEINGRQIKNATSCAYSITSDTKQTLDMQTLRPILELVTSGGLVGGGAGGEKQ